MEQTDADGQCASRFCRKVLASNVTRSMVQQIVDRVVARGANVQARRTYEITRAMLRWGVGRDYITGEPWRGVELPERGEARERVLTAAELRWLWNHGAKTWADAPNMLRIVRLQVLLGQRSGEVCGMCPAELADNLLTWTIPGERTKNGQTHVLPLPPLAREIIRETLAVIPKDQEPLFAGARGKVERADRMSHVVADLIIDYNAETKPEDRVEAFTPHDLRRTMATGLEAMGISTNVTSATLNHISAKGGSVTTKHYTHADLTMEMRGALTRWQATVEAIMAGANPFEQREEDIEELERRMLAKGYGGPARLRVVS